MRLARPGSRSPGSASPRASTRTASADGFRTSRLIGSSHRTRGATAQLLVEDRPTSSAPTATTDANGHLTLELPPPPTPPPANQAAERDPEREQKCCPRAANAGRAPAEHHSAVLAITDGQDSTFTAIGRYEKTTRTRSTLRAGMSPMTAFHLSQPTVSMVLPSNGWVTVDVHEMARTTDYSALHSARAGGRHRAVRS
jgi:hypothetical protein